jgi:hypothetical protein
VIEKSVAGGGEGHLERLVLWPQFTGAEWQLPTDVRCAERLLVGWRFRPEPVEAGPPPAVAMLLVVALGRHGTLSFASAVHPPLGGGLLARTLRRRPKFVWHTSASSDDAVAGIFFADFFSWNLRGQVVCLGMPGVHLVLSERYLQISSDPRLFDELATRGVQGILLPGVDGAVAGLYFFNAAIASAVHGELVSLARAAGGHYVIATGPDFSAQLRGGPASPAS